MGSKAFTGKHRMAESGGGKEEDKNADAESTGLFSA